MQQMTQVARKTDTLQVRITPDMKTVLSEAAALYDTTLSEFVIQSAFRMAKTVLSDSQRIQLNAKEWKELLNRMNKPARRHDRLARLFSEKGLFDDE